MLLKLYSEGKLTDTEQTNIYTSANEMGGGVYRFTLFVCLSVQYICCPQLFLNDLQDSIDTLWSYRLHNGDVHIFRKFIWDILCRKYEHMD